MVWVVAVALVLLAVLVLGVVLLKVWRRVKALGADVRRASEAVERASEGITASSQARPRHATGGPGAFG